MYVVGITIAPEDSVSTHGHGARTYNMASFQPPSVSLTFGDGVRIGYGEWLLGHVRHHDDGRAVPEQLLDDSPGVGQGFQLLQVHGCVDISVPHLEVLLAHSVQDVGTLCHDLEEPGSRAAAGILRGEQEGEDGLGDLPVGEVAEHRRRLLEPVRGQTLLLSLAPPLGIHHGLDPAVHDAGNLSAGGHPDLALGGALGKFLQHHVGGLLAVPRLGERDDDGEVHQLEGGRDEVVVVGDLLDGLVRHVVADEGAARDGAHDLAHLGHEGDWLASGVLGDLDEPLEVLVVHLILAGQVALERLLGKQAVEALAEIDVGLAVQEHPVIRSEEFMGDIDDARLDVARGVEDLPGHVTGRGDDNKPGRGFLVRDRSRREGGKGH